MDMGGKDYFGFLARDDESERAGRVVTTLNNLRERGALSQEKTEDPNEGRGKMKKMKDIKPEIVKSDKQGIGDNKYD